MPAQRLFDCIAAMDMKRGIGKNNELPWHLPNEFKYFSRITKSTISKDNKNAVVMGKNTWYSIPKKFRPLKGRLNIVISRSMQNSDLPEDVLLFESLPACMKVMSAEVYLNSIENIFITGGSSLYKEAMESGSCGLVYLTKVQSDFNCDVFYPEFDTENIFKEVTRDNVPTEVQKENDIKYTFHVYKKNQ